MKELFDPETLLKSTGKLTAPLRITQQKKKLEEYVNLLLIEGYRHKNTTQEPPAIYSRWMKGEERFNFDGCSQPMKIEDISFEKNNNLAINVFHIKSTGKLITPLRITSKEVKLEEYVNLLLIEGENDCHYTWIRNLDRLLSYGDRNQRKFCPFCLQGFDKRG